MAKNIENTVGFVKTECLKLRLPKDGYKLEGGGVLPEIEVAYERCGKSTPEHRNVVFICHALTGDAHVAGLHEGEAEPSGWWEGMIGPGKGIDTDTYEVICANVLGGCMGTTGPSSTNPTTGKPYGSAFPKISMGDMVEINRLLLQQLGIDHVHAIAGGSFGGMLVIDWITRHPEDADKAIIIASAPRMSTQSLAFDLIGRRAIVDDPKWCNGDYYGNAEQPDAGLTSARQIAHVTYLSNELLEERFGRERRPEWLEQAEKDPAFRTEMERRFQTYFQLESYLQHQGVKFCRRFDANSYLHITYALDNYSAEEKFGSIAAAFARVKAKVLFVSLSGDWLFEPKQSAEMTRACLEAGVRVSYFKLDAPTGHDAFITHVADLRRVVRAFMPTTDAEHERTSRKWQERHYANVLKLVEKNSRVYDLGCGDGALLTLLHEKLGCTGCGFEIDVELALKALAAGCNVVTEDLDSDLATIPAGSADAVVLSETLQTIRQPRRLIRHVLSIAPRAVVSFPNFACWDVRFCLLFSGRMPKGKQLPFEWYNTPNIHLFTLRDFLALCREEAIKVAKLRAIPRGFLGTLLRMFGFRNLGASRIVAMLARTEEPAK